MLVVMLLSPVIGVCHDDEFCASLGSKTVSTFHGQQEFPHCPDAGHRDPSCDNCAACPCHAPLPSSVITVSVTRPEIIIPRREPLIFLPEVYISLFDPPDVSA